jgi:uncharacterized membrane protein
MAETNVVAITFPEQARAYQALSVLKGLAAEDRVGLLSAAVVERDPSGALQVREGADPVAETGVAGGALVGTLIGVLGGPLGMLLGFGTGALIGGTVDLERASTTDAVMSELARAIPPGSLALVAEVVEYAEEVIDTEMAQLEGSVLRRPAVEVLTELEAAAEATAAAEQEAHRRVREQRRTEAKEKYEERKDQLRQKLGLA